MLSAGSVFILSTSLLFLYALLTTWEGRRGSRLIFTGLRDYFDTLVGRIFEFSRQKLNYLVRHTIKLSWYYSIHKMLRGTMTLLVRAYDRLELVFVENRNRAKVLREEKRVLQNVKNHLTEMAEHKVSTALTPSQKKKLKEKKLERE
jgi:hypothetical protein